MRNVDKLQSSAEATNSEDISRNGKLTHATGSAAKLSMPSHQAAALIPQVRAERLKDPVVSTVLVNSREWTSTQAHNDIADRQLRTFAVCASGQDSASGEKHSLRVEHRSSLEQQLPDCQNNPLENVPIVIFEHGKSIYERAYIPDYIEAKQPDAIPLLPLDPEQIDEALFAKEIAIVATGVCDALLQQVCENQREEDKRSNLWIDRQQWKVDGSLKALAEWLPDHKDFYVLDGIGLADITTGSTLEYLRLRLPDHPWQTRCPDLARYCEGLEKRQSFVESVPIAQPFTERIFSFNVKKNKMAESCTNTYTEQELLQPSKSLLDACETKFVSDSRNLSYKLYEEGESKQAAAILERLRSAQRMSHGEEDWQYLRSTYDLAGIRYEQGRPSEAQKLCEHLLPLDKRVLGEAHSHTLNTMALVANCYRDQGKLDEGEELLKKVIASLRQRFGPEYLPIYRHLRDLALLYQRKGAIEAARDIYLECIEGLEKQVDDEHPILLLVQTNLACIYGDRGDDIEAAKMWRRVVVGRVHGWGGWGSEDPESMLAFELASNFHQERSQGDQALEIWRKVFWARKRILGPYHAFTLDAQMYLCRSLHLMEDYEDASELAEQVLARQTEVLGFSSSITTTSTLGEVIDTKLWLGMCYQNLDQYKQEAEQLFLQVISASQDLWRKAPHIFLLYLINGHYSMGSLQRDQKNIETAIHHRRQALRYCHKDPPPSLRRTIMCVEGLADVLLSKEEYAEVESLTSKGIEQSEAAWGPSSITMAELMAVQSYCLVAQNRFREAKPLLERVLRIFEDKYGPSSPALGPPAQHLAECALRLGEYTEAETWFERAAYIYEAMRPLRGDLVAFCVRLLLEALHKQGKFEKLEAVETEWATKGLTFEVADWVKEGSSSDTSQAKEEEDNQSTDGASLEGNLEDLRL